jgi:hypothetical protein
MKNVHILPTDKPSRLYKSIDNELSFTDIEFEQTNNFNTNQNIYITSDEEIKQGEKGWLLENSCNVLNVCEFDCSKGIGGIYPSDKKIILTTDQDLIADGVQPIDDEFLEWFVKNPSCEEVETFVDTMGCSLENCNGNHCVNYKIIIPKEELKQELNLNCFDCNKSLQDCTCIENTINMTDPLEQAAKEYAERHLDVSGNLGKYLVKAVFQDGVKWEQEQDKNKYSEEEVRKLFKQYKEDFSIYRNQQILNVEFEDWFEQFKKK